jgi:hypothetical protein
MLMRVVDGKMNCRKFTKLYEFILKNNGIGEIKLVLEQGLMTDAYMIDRGHKS